MRCRDSSWGVSALVGLMVACGSDDGGGSGVNSGPQTGDPPDTSDAGMLASNAGDPGGMSGSNGPSSGGSQDGGSAAGGGQEGCAATVTDATLTPANMLFVIDRSGSMNCNPPEGDEALNELCKTTPQKEYPNLPSKWEVTKNALSTALDGLAEQSNVRAGLVVFPREDPVKQCQLSVEPDLAIEKLDGTHRSAIEAFLDAVTPRGDTPLGGATLLSYEYLRQQLVEQQSLVGNLFVVVLTDGAETCDESAMQRLVDRDVTLATDFNIRTFVIGAPGSEGERARLSELAYRGLTSSSDDCAHGGNDDAVGDCHFDMTETDNFAEALSDALQAISNDRSLSCEFELPSGNVSVDLNKVNVSYTDGDGMTEAVLQDPDADCLTDADGWQYSENRTKIILCGDVCDRVQADPQAEVEIVLGCKTQTVIR